MFNTHFDDEIEDKSKSRSRSRPQVARYRLMNDDEEFEASPNEFSSEEDEEQERGSRDQNNNRFKGSSFGQDNPGSSDVNQFQPKKWGNVGSSYSRDREQAKDPTPVNARNFFQQKAAETPELPTSVSGAAAMFGGKLKPSGQRNFGKSAPAKSEPTNIQEPRKSTARERSMSRDRDGTAMTIERTRTRGESRERPRRAESRRRNESKDRNRTRDRSEDRISAAPSIRRAKSRSRRDPSLKRAERDLSVDAEKPRRRDRR